MKRRLTAILIILCMAFALLPATVLAAGETVTEAYTISDFYKGLNAGGIIELKANITTGADGMLPLPKSVTIHGNGYTLTLHNDCYFYVGKGITLTLGREMSDSAGVDLTIKGNGINKDAHNLIVVWKGGSLTAKHVVMQDRYMAYSNAYRMGAAIHAEGAESVTLENCTIKNCKALSDSAFYIDMRSSTAAVPTVRITDCVFEENIGVISGSGSTGGRVMFHTGSLTLQNTTVRNNKVPISGSSRTRSGQTAFHIMFDDEAFRANIENCSFVNNTSDDGTGGLEIAATADKGTDKDFSSCLTMKNCTITGNVSTNGEIGGLWISTTAKTVFDLTGNVICNNKAKVKRIASSPSDVELIDFNYPNANVLDTARFPEPVGMGQKTADGKDINAWFSISKNAGAATPTQIVDLEHVKSSGDLIYYAGHVTPTYELRYEGNDPEGSTVGNLPSTQTEATDDASVTFPISRQEPTCSDYRFTGWKVDGGTTEAFQPGDPITVTVPVTTLLAQWEKDIPDAPADPAALLKVRVLCDANDSHEEQIYDLLTGDTVTLGTVEPTEDGTYQLSGSITYADVEQYVGLYSAEYGSHRLEEEKGSNAFTLKWNKETRAWELTSCATIVVACGDGYNPVLPLLPLLRGQGVPRLNTADHFAYVQGYTDGTVRPDGNITRAETAAILFRLMDDDTRRLYYSTSAGFRDVDSSKWYNTYVATLNNAGVITDSANGSFRPDDAITRAELAAMLAQFAEQKTAVNYFSDVISRNRYANAIALTASLGWINGYPDGTFRPNQSITRAELMAIINRATNRAPKSTEALLAGMNTWTDNMDTSAWYYLDVQEATNSHTYMGNPTEYWTGLEADPDWSQYE